MFGILDLTAPLSRCRSRKGMVNSASLNFLHIGMEVAQRTLQATTYQFICTTGALTIFFAQITHNFVTSAFYEYLVVYIVAFSNQM